MQTAVFISVSAGHPANLSFFCMRIGAPPGRKADLLHRTGVRRAGSRRPLPRPPRSSRSPQRRAKRVITSEAKVSSAPAPTTPGHPYNVQAAPENSVPSDPPMK